MGLEGIGLLEEVEGSKGAGGMASGLSRWADAMMDRIGVSSTTGC